jgi:hypothetical protein
MASFQSVCLRKISGHRAGERMMGRFFSNERVTREHLKKDITDKVRDVCSNRHVLCLQDTTEINHHSHKNRVTGLGPVGNPKNIGFFLHPALVIDGDDKTCLGLSPIHTHVRALEKKKRYQGEKIETKESFRWIETAQSSKAVLEKAKMITIVADRESDIYEEWVRIPDDKTHLLIRACKDRCLKDGSKLFETVSSIPVKTRTRLNS